MTSNLEWLQQFYLSLCNGDWEHSYGCKIDNVDNPGWSLEFELADTVYENIPGPDVSKGAHQSVDGPDWIVLKKVGSKVDGACGPMKLDELLGEFRSWADKVEPLAARIQENWNRDPFMQAENDRD